MFQVYSEVLSLIELCRGQLKVVQLTSSMSPSDLVGSFPLYMDIIVIELLEVVNVEIHC